MIDIFGIAIVCLKKKVSLWEGKLSLVDICSSAEINRKLIQICVASDTVAL